VGGSSEGRRKWVAGEGGKRAAVGEKRRRSGCMPQEAKDVSCSLALRLRVEVGKLDISIGRRFLGRRRRRSVLLTVLKII